MIKRTITIPALNNIEFDNTENNIHIHVERPYPQVGPDIYFDALAPRGETTVTFFFQNGAKIVLEPEVVRQYEHYCVVTEKVELEEGKIYQVADRRKPNDKWLALCTYNLKMDELVVEPIRGGGYPSFEESTKHNYTFYKEFDLDLKEHL